MLLNQPYLPQATTATRRAHRSLPRILLCPEYCSVQNTALPGILICLRYLNFLAYFAMFRTNQTHPKPPLLQGVITDHCQEYCSFPNTALSSIMFCPEYCSASDTLTFLPILPFAEQTILTPSHHRYQVCSQIIAKNTTMSRILHRLEYCSTQDT